MCNIILEKHFDRIKAAYEASVFTKGIRPESEDNIKKFELIMLPYPQSTVGCYLTWEVAIWRNRGFLT